MKYILVLVSVFCSEFVLGQINPNATKETQNLYRNLLEISGKPIFFGHQDALSYGLNPDKSRWVGDKNRADVQSVTGEYPAVIGYDLGRLEFDSLNNLDGVPFDEMRRNIVVTYKRGGLSTISWHLNNPVNPLKTSWDKEEFTIRRVLSNPEKLKVYYSWLDRVSDFLLNLKDKDGTLVPVIFRPLHEHTGSWFWWGADHCTPDEYKEFWSLTINYLLKTKGVNNILIGYSTDVFRDKRHYLERYPGNDFADILGFDIYHRNAPESNQQFSAQLKRMLSELKLLGAENRKPIAITETGLEQIVVADWWTGVLLPVIADSGISYFLVWRNGYDKHYYAPFSGQASGEDFKKMIKSKKVVLEKGIRQLSIYRNREN